MSMYDKYCIDCKTKDTLEWREAGDGFFEKWWQCNTCYHAKRHLEDNSSELT